MTGIVILLATRNGERFLQAQLDSILGQSHRDWRLVVSDDASTDRTRQIVDAAARGLPSGQITRLDGPGQGATMNFCSLLRRTDPAGDHLAFCDQDDVWEADHLARAVQILKPVSGGAAVYGCRMRICGADLRQTGLSPLPRRPLGFRNALVQNVLSGNTMVLTPAAARLLRAAETEAGPGMPLHDWWAYQLITGAGGAAILDERPGLYYRQHGGNVIGAHRGFSGLKARLRRHLGGAYRQLAERNCAALSASAARLTEENRRVLVDFTRALALPWPRGIAALRQSGVYHQSPQARTAFWLSAATGRF
ncbi:MAG: glycosyltransferase [Paracoccus sp. (in: a-proteobacteria)]